jgi:chorismate mutase
MKHHIELDNCRKQIDALDEELLLVILKRMNMVRKIAVYKKAKSLPARDQNRWNTIIDHQQKRALRLGLHPVVVKKLWDIIHEYSLEIEKEII